jgi:hypothetical protein
MFLEFFDSCEKTEKPSPVNPKKATDNGLTGAPFCQIPYSPPPLTSSFIQQNHSHNKVIGIFSQRYHITHVGGNAVALAKLELILPLASLCVTKCTMV